MSVRLLLFGPPRLAQGGGALALAFERRSQLLAHLALRRGWVPRMELATLLWPAAPVEQALANLRKTLFRVRTLPWADALVVQEQALAFEGASDVTDFESAMTERRSADALEIGGAPLLAGFDDDASEPWSAWLCGERERLRAAWRAAARQCLAAAADPADVLTLSARLLAEDPLDESALRAQMLAYAQQGQPAHAREAYRAHAARLAERLGSVPSAELQALHGALFQSTGTAARSTASVATDRESSRIVGRVAEQRSARARLEEGCRLLTLVGPGGVGKSCLARHLLSDLARLYADGSAYIPLDDVASPDAIGARLARDLGVSLSDGSDPLQAVIGFLGGRRMLLVLDNFEHLYTESRQLQTLLDACPRVQLLVTSRTRLGLAGEYLLPLDGLACPEPEDADCLQTFDAAKLFVRAAQAVEPTLKPAQEAAAIIEICRLVDGLPLALEIAAGWTRVLSCEAIAAELQMGVALLTESDAARPPRHASMAAVFDQSWRRLSPAERAAWARLTVFQGGFTPDAARVVTGAGLPVLAALTDQSLLRKTGARADLHPLLRQLAAPYLAADEHDATRAAHAAYYLQGLMPLLAGLRSGNKEALQQVDIEFENVRTAWRWAAAHGPAQALQSAVLPLLSFCDLRGRRLEGLALLRDAAAGVGAGDALLRPLVDAAAAHLECRMERYGAAQALAERALQASRITRDHETRLQCYKVLGACAIELGRPQQALRRYRQALAQAPAAIDPRNAASMLMNIATVEQDLGRYDAARELYTRALVEQRRIRDSVGEAMCLANLASLELDTDGLMEVAAAHLEASLALCEHHALPGTKIVALINMTDVAVRRNDAAAAHRHGRRAFELASRLSARGLESVLRMLFAQLAWQQRDYAGARDALRAAVEDALAIDRVALQLDGVLCFAYLLHAQGEVAAATRLLGYAIGHPATIGPSRDRARRRLAAWAPQPDANASPAPAVDLWTLVHRIIAEAPAGHTALIEMLRAP